MADRLGLVVAPGTDLPSAAKPSPEPEPDPLKGGDVYGWAVEQAALIRAGRYEDIDWINVADEIDSVGKSEYRALSSNLEVVLSHILKWHFQPRRRSRSWRPSIKEHRRRVERDLAGNPSLKPRIGEAVAEAYDFARLVAERETGLDADTLPADCPYDWDAIMTRSFVLDPTDEAQ